MIHTGMEPVAQTFFCCQVVAHVQGGFRRDDQQIFGAIDRSGFRKEGFLTQGSQFAKLATGLAKVTGEITQPIEIDVSHRVPRGDIAWRRGQNRNIRPRFWP